MKKLILFAFTIFFLSLKPVFSQQSYELGIQMPNIILIDLYPDDTIYLTDDEIGEEINLDEFFTVYSQGISYTRQWKFRSGSTIQTLDDPWFTLTNDGVLYLTIINEYGCSYYDSIFLSIETTGIEDIKYNRGNTQSINIYPNPNSGTFDVIISECQPGFTIEMINLAGVQLINQILECSNNEYSGKIIMPSIRSGTYYILVKKAAGLFTDKRSL
jgi:hypothetical protein